MAMWPAEDVYSRDSRAARSANLRENGATEEEVEFLLDRRVELNALPSDELIAFIERRLTENGIKKIIPDAETLASAYRRMRKQAALQAAIDEALVEIEEDHENDEKKPVPADLCSRIEEAQRRDPTVQWDVALRRIAKREASQ